jgi:NitT/TauT family transport system permease protein
VLRHSVLHRDVARGLGISWRDVVAFMMVLSLITLLSLGVRQMTAPFAALEHTRISLAPSALPNYALRTTMRMLAALALSLLFTFAYGALAAKSKRAEMVLIPLLDVLQSVPTLGFLTYAVIFFVRLAPGSSIGAECAVIFVIFTSQAWNMAFSFYQSLITVPRDLVEASSCFRFSAWQRFWRLEVPFALPALIWNMMVSMSTGWFYLVASEAISVGSVQLSLPGIGSYVAQAIASRSYSAILWAILAMSVVIVLIDQLLFRPLVVWADKFRFEMTAPQVGPRSWALDVFSRAKLFGAMGKGIGTGLNRIFNARMTLGRQRRGVTMPSRSKTVFDIVWYVAIAAVIGLGIWRFVESANGELSWRDVAEVFERSGVTFVRVAALTIAVTIVWVPLGVLIGLRPKLAERIQPLVQFLAAFPANLVFPFAVLGIVRFRLDPNIALTPLMVLGTQWYLVFNVIAGATEFPTDLREAAATFRIHGWRWWRDVILPGIFPYYVTGAINAAGGAWSASIVAERVSWGSITLTATGIGSYIAEMTDKGDVPRLTLAIFVMSLFVVCINRLFWRRLYAFAERRMRLD